ncbi:MAG: hypothetical protein ACK4L4_06175 [Gemmobacter sp.]
MCVVVQPSGAIMFRYDYRVTGRRETLTLGRYGSELPRRRSRGSDLRRPPAA